MFDDLLHISHRPMMATSQWQPCISLTMPSPFGQGGVAAHGSASHQLDSALHNK
jgi:hypothetical protein